MATALDTTLGAAALSVIAKVGITATWTVPTSSTYSGATGTNAVTTTTHTVKISPPLEYEDSQIDGELVRVGDAAVFVAGSGLAFTPTPNQSVTISGQKWTVVRVSILRSGDLVAAYKAQLRR